MQTTTTPDFHYIASATSDKNPELSLWCKPVSVLFNAVITLAMIVTSSSLIVSDRFPLKSTLAQAPWMLTLS